MAVINNVAYSWSMVRISIPGLDMGEDSSILAGCTAVKWNKNRKIANNYGIGGKPRTRGFGNEVYEASVTLDYNAQVQLRALSEDGTLMGLGEFDLIISWANAHAGTDWITETTTLKGCVFNEEGLDTKQDDTSVEKELALNPFDIINDTAA